MIIQPVPVDYLVSAITLPEFNVFAVQFGDFGIRWYALAYIAGLLIGIYILRRETLSSEPCQNPRNYFTTQSGACVAAGPLLFVF